MYIPTTKLHVFINHPSRSSRTWKLLPIKAEEESAHIKIKEGAARLKAEQEAEPARIKAEEEAARIKTARIMAEARGRGIRPYQQQGGRSCPYQDRRGGSRAISCVQKCMKS
ncbi:hypothetical protein P167DRAFT_565885 [Morchella conica CCBAS932]|uniref:Uncharacterized protein n=1 Tax=Morchella conica CCBAS932 TaxID=1392247 RepID=A0A3N4KL51_9PEZI|nr:hypothetical protein P167DRAFT_565885 [Morchella conica CCBAS932]